MHMTSCLSSGRAACHLLRILQEEENWEMYLDIFVSVAGIRMQIMLKRNASSATAELLFHF